MKPEYDKLTTMEVLMLASSLSVLAGALVTLGILVQ